MTGRALAQTAVTLDSDSVTLPSNPTPSGTTNGVEGVIIPVMQGSNGGGDIVATSTTATTTATTSPSDPIVTIATSDTNTGGSSFVGSSSSGGSSYGSGGDAVTPSLAVSTPGPLSVQTFCPLITSYLQFGANNDGQQVSQLQAFLKESEGLDVDVTGTFDQKTDAGVKAFQAKYLADIMGPWGSSVPSGYVYITTSKKINELACNTPIALDASELAIIDAYKSQEAQNSQNAAVIPVDSTAATPIIPETPNATTTPLAPLVGENVSTSSTNVAAAIVGASALDAIWNFFKGLF
jgi:hypothetical protein